MSELRNKVYDLSNRYNRIDSSCTENNNRTSKLISALVRRGVIGEEFYIGGKFIIDGKQGAIDLHGLNKKVDLILDHLGLELVDYPPKSVLEKKS